MARGEECEQGEQWRDEGCLGLAALRTNVHWKHGFWFLFPALSVGRFAWQGFGCCTLPSVSAGGRFPAQGCFAWKRLGCDPSVGPALPYPFVLGAECVPRLWRIPGCLHTEFCLAAVFCALCQVNSHSWLSFSRHGSALLRPPCWWWGRLHLLGNAHLLLKCLGF